MCFFVVFFLFCFFFWGGGGVGVLLLLPFLFQLWLAVGVDSMCVSLCHDLFDFDVFAMMHRLSWEPLCEPNLYVHVFQY